MKPNPRYSLIDFQRKFLVYSFLQDYYSGSFWQKREKWNDILIMLAETRYQEEIVFFNLGMQLIHKPTDNALYDFNRLFVGPGRLLAPPYESAYRNEEGLLMKEETLDVRRFYSLVGLAAVRQNCEPDDFIALELEFLSFLLYQSFSYYEEDIDRSTYYFNLYFEFLEKHIGKWVPAHCEDILKHSNSYFCKGVAMLTKGFIEHELMQRPALTV